MAVEKLFWEDPYLTSNRAVVTSVLGDRVTLDKSVFFAFSGGQSSDQGTIDCLPVIKADKDEASREIYYTLPQFHTLKTKDIVTVSIDWETRYAIMRLHFAAELVLELVNQLLRQPEKLGAHITSRSARLDFAYGENISRHFPQILEQISRLESSNQDIISDWEDRDSERRFWEIPGFAKVACGGTHLRNTGEVGGLQLKRSNPGKGKERIEIRLV